MCTYVLWKVIESARYIKDNETAVVLQPPIINIYNSVALTACKTLIDTDLSLWTELVT
jgi:hypothetical protein